MLTVIAQGLLTDTGQIVLMGTMLAFLVCNAIPRWQRAGRLPPWLSALFFLILFADLLVFGRVSGEGWACAITLAVTFAAYLLLTKSGRSVLRPENRHAGRPAPVVPHARGRLTIYVVVTTLVVLVVALPLSAALTKLLESYAPGWAEALDMPIFFGAFFVLTFATLDCLWRWLEGSRARRL